MKIFKSIITLLLLLFLSIHSYSQDNVATKTVWSKVFKNSIKILGTRVFYHDKECVLISREINKVQYIERYNAETFELEKKVAVKLKHDKNKLNLLYKSVLGDQIILYSTVYNKSERIKSAYIHKMNLKSLEISEPILVREVEFPRGMGTLVPNMYKPDYNWYHSGKILYSENGEYAYIQEEKYELIDDKSNSLKTTHINGKIYNANFDLIGEASYNAPDPNFKCFQKKIGNNGKLYQAGYHAELIEGSGGLLMGDSTAYGDLEFVIFEPKTGEVNSIKTPVKDGIVSAFSFTLTDDGGFIVSGLSGMTAEELSGAFYFKYNGAFEVVHSSITEFEAGFINMDWYLHEKTELKMTSDGSSYPNSEGTNPPKFFKYKVKGLIVKPNGTITLLAEQYYYRVVVRPSTSPGVSGVASHMYLRDIVVLNFDANGEILWKKVIPKYQHSVQDGGVYSSFFTVIDDSDIHLIYSDFESKVNGKGVKAMRFHINANGEVSEHEFLAYEKSHERLLPWGQFYADKKDVLLVKSSNQGYTFGIYKW